MTIKVVPKFTPELLITAPRPSPAIPNDEGKLALYTVSTYDLDTHTEYVDVKFLDLETGKASLVTDDKKNHSHQWLSGSLLLWQREREDGRTELWIGDVAKNERPYHAGLISASISDVKTKRISDCSIALTFTAAADKDQNLFNIKGAEKSHMTAREWDSSRPRCWDTYLDQYRSVLWFTTLNEIEGKYKLSDIGPINALRDTGMVLPYFSNPLNPVDYDISKEGVIFSTNDPQADEWQDHSQVVYYLPVKTFQETDVPALRKLKIPGLSGSATSPRFAPSGPVAALLVDKEQVQFSYKTICLVRLDNPNMIMQIDTFADRSLNSVWDVLPASLTWANDRNSLYVTADEHAVTKVFKVSIDTPNIREHKTVPVALSVPGSVSAFQPLSISEDDDRLLVNSSSFIDPLTISIVTPSTDSTTLATTKVISSASQHGSVYGISASQISSIHYPGGPDGKTQIQCWIIKPSSYSKSSKKYPLFLMMHGGPQVALTDSWSTRWNNAFFAEQGYIVAIPNFTGTESFGQEFVRAIDRQWGGFPYLDLERCFEWVEKNEPRCDTTRAVAAGGSYGGYLANWVAGQPLAKKLKAIVCHDGIFDVMGSMLGDDIVTAAEVQNIFGSKLWEHYSDRDKAMEGWRKNNPVEYIDNWSTPMLFIHSNRDYRCQITDAWAAYNVCKLKGIETRILNFPDENHWVLGRENNLKWQKTVMGWCNHYVGIENGIKLEPAVSEAPWLGVTQKGRILED